MWLPGKTLVYEPDAETIDLDNVPLNGGVLVKTLYLSIDPYFRGRMRDPKIQSYSVPFVVGKPLSVFSPCILCGRLMKITPVARED